MAQTFIMRDYIKVVDENEYGTKWESIYPFKDMSFLTYVFATPVSESYPEGSPAFISMNISASTVTFNDKLDEIYSAYLDYQKNR